MRQGLQGAALAVSLVLGMGVAHADDCSFEEKVEHRLSTMTREFGLSAEQQQRVRPLLAAEEKRRLARTERKRAEKAEQREQLANILTTEQMTRLDTRDKGPGKGGPRADAGRAEAPPRAPGRESSAARPGHEPARGGERAEARGCHAA